ncbi:hypothetical protein SLS62_002101 [Diatrype stigma]|uniref:Peroxisomal membrane protein PEX14 n=1 Tax=Diatrype stigma TaxID=117547 RepID=A0AAN9UXQ3_9PEZI
MADERNQIPAWQQAQTEPNPPAETKTSKPNDVSASEATETTTEASIEQARQFLKDENVQGHSVEKKAEFLKSKGFSDEQIQALLGEKESASEAKTAVKSEPPEASSPAPPSPSTQQEASPTAASSSSITESRRDVPPIITYPEFLTTSPRPPPLITPSRLLNILTVSGGVFTFLYGSARYLVNPMVSDRDDARADYHNHVGERLGELVEKLEEVVSEVPYKDKDGKVVLNSRAATTTEGSDDRGHEDNESTFSDPTELFHRDFGTQTSTPPESLATRSPTTLAEKEKEKGQNPIDKQAGRLASLRASLGELNDMYTRRAEDSADLDATLRSIRDDVDGLALPPSGSYAYYSSADSSRGPNGADEEFRRTKDAIRSVKGMFLSARSFPTVSAR